MTVQFRNLGLILGSIFQIWHLDSSFLDVHLIQLFDFFVDLVADPHVLALYSLVRQLMLLIICREDPPLGMLLRLEFTILPFHVQLRPCEDGLMHCMCRVR